MSQIRFLYILKILAEETDRGHGITLHQIRNRLYQNYGDESWEEQRIRADLALVESLCERGELPYRLDKLRGAHNEYQYRFYRPCFGLNEARLVFDSVSISRFLSDEKKRELLSALEGILSHREVTSLKERVRSRPGSCICEELPENLQIIYQALEEHCCLRFGYYKFDVNHIKQLEKEYRHIHPIRVIWGEEHYYMLALNPEHGRQRRYRIDRMGDLRTDDGPWLQICQGEAGYGQFDMFGTSLRKQVVLRVHRNLLDMTFEILSPNLLCSRDPDPDWVRITDTVEISEGFYRWVLQQGGKMQLLQPPEERTEIKKRLQQMLESYPE